MRAWLVIKRPGMQIEYHPWILGTGHQVATLEQLVRSNHMQAMSRWWLVCEE